MIAHMKLGVLLRETGYEFDGDQRLEIYLTNSLEEAFISSETHGFTKFLTDEGNAASDIKREKPIMVVLGNPPYSVSSANKGKHIEGLMERYKVAVKNERNIQPLSDDYIKFIRFAHDRIERTGYGVIGMITNHTYLSGLIHRGMRQELIRAFSEIYILNIHGNALLGETAPDGRKDQNVFDIRQGVAIALFLKKSEKGRLATVKYADLWGRRDTKYSYLNERDVSNTDWRVLKPGRPYFFFIPRKLDLTGEYETGWRVDEMFLFGKVGITSGDDHFFYDMDTKTEIEKLKKVLKDGYIQRTQVRKKINDNFRSIRKDCINESLYRPFDKRCVYYDEKLLWRPVSELATHFPKRDLNVALITLRRTREDSKEHIFITTNMIDKAVISSKDNAFAFPLYLYAESEQSYSRSFAIDNAKQIVKKSGKVPAKKVHAEQDRIANLIRRLYKEESYPKWPNFHPDFLADIGVRLGLSFKPSGKGDLRDTYGPEDIFNYCYALLHSPSYRERYAEYLKIDFPRVPLTSHLRLFKALSSKGEELIALHLMESSELNRLVTGFPLSGSNEVEKIFYINPSQENGTRGRLFINRKQYFEGIDPELWEFRIGGYQVLQKWLKDRKDRKLSFDEILHYQKVVVAIKETIRVMKEIDELIPSWPIK
jgi:predicted helicase